MADQVKGKRVDVNQIAARLVAQSTGPHEQVCSGCGARFATELAHPIHQELDDGGCIYWDADSYRDNRDEPVHKCHGT